MFPRRGKALYLNEHLYAQLKRIWLHHGVQEHVVGRYELDQRNFLWDWLYY